MEKFNNNKIIYIYFIKKQFFSFFLYLFFFLMIVIVLLILTVIFYFICCLSVLFKGEQINLFFRQNIKQYLTKLEEGKCRNIEKRCFKIYIKYVPNSFREIDRENGLANNLPDIFEKILYVILSYKFWISLFIIQLLLIIIIIVCLNLSLIIPLFLQQQHFNECDYSNNEIQCYINNSNILNDINQLYDSIILYPHFIKNYTSENKIEIFINHDGLIILLLKYINYNGDEITSYFNFSSIELFLNKWKNEYYNNNDNINYCFCPLYIGIKNNNLQFIYDYDFNKWLIIYNFTIKEDSIWTRKQTLKTIIKYKEKKLQNFVNNLTDKEFITIDKNIIIKYYDIKPIKEEEEEGKKKQLNETTLFINYNNSYIKEQILNVKQTSCIIHCLDLIN